MSDPGKLKVSLFTATCLVVANMVGTGVFTSLGFQIGDLPSGFIIVVLWLIGGLCALCGALCYAELATALPRSGGEYHLVGRTIHPALGFLSGWLSATVGFAAPIALAAIALGEYAARISDHSGGIVLNVGSGIKLEQAVAVLAVALTTIIHLNGIKFGAVFQNAATVFKLVLILVVVVAGLFASNPQPIQFLPSANDGALLLHPAFAVSLVYVMYAYCGWNAATYIVGELRNPTRDIPRALIGGTALVTLLYVGVNCIFLRTTPIAEMRGELEVGLIAGHYIFGTTGGKIVGAFICLGLIASISAMTWVGPRVSATMGEDILALRWLAPRRGGAPRVALVVQFVIVATLILTSGFKAVLVFIQFALTLCSTLTVIGLFVLRRREPDLVRPFRVPWYPVTPLVFLAISGWMLVHIAMHQPTESLAGVAVIASGLIIYFASPKAPVAGKN